MSSQNINGYAIDRLSLGDDDYFDIDYFNGSSYETAKIKGSVIKSLLSSGINIYNTDGLVSANRTVDLNGYALVFDNGQGIEITNVKTFGTEITIPSFLIPNYGVKHDVDTTNWAGDNTKRIFQVKDTNLNTIVLAAMNGGRLLINEAYYLPNADGGQGQVLRTDGAGSLSFANLSIGLFSQTADGTPVTNTTTPTNIIGTGIGSLSVPANAFQVGDSFHCNIKGDISSLNNETLLIELKSGAVVLASSGTLTLPAMTNQPFEIETDFTIRTVGAATTASIFTCSEFNYIQNSGTSFQGKMFQTLNNTTFDTTISNTLEVCITWGSASTSNSILSHLTNLRGTY